MNKKKLGFTGGGAAGLIILLIVGAFFQPIFNAARGKVEESLRISQSPELANKHFLEAEWESKKNLFISNPDSSEFLNAWLKDFITYAQSHSLKIDKLEPAGVKEGPNGKETSILISFQSDIRKFNEFVYFLLEKDPLSRIQSVFVRQDENSKNLSFEIMLGKALP